MRAVTFRRIRCLLLCGLASFSISVAGEAGPTDQLQIQVIEGRPVVHGVMVQGHGPYTFLLDTGAQANSVASDLAAAMNWRPAYRVEVASVAGVIWRGAFVASSVTFGSAQADRQEFVIEPLSEIRGLSRKIDGVLGQAFLGRFNYLLDLRRKRLVFGDLGAAGGPRTPVEWSHGRMVASTSRGRLVIDSGVNTLILQGAEELWTGGRTRLETQTGAATVLTGTVTLHIGGRQFPNIAAALVPGSRGERETEGLLPVSLLGSLYVSNSGAYVIIRPDL